jgi:hypothetical protein
MSLKDRLRFKGYPLPAPEAAGHDYAVEGYEGVEDHLEVRSDGSLWRNRNGPFWLSDAAAEQPAWEREPLTGELVVSHYVAAPADTLRWSLYFVDGQLHEIHRVDGHRRRLAQRKE